MPHSRRTSATEARRQFRRQLHRQFAAVLRPVRDTPARAARCSTMPALARSSRTTSLRPAPRRGLAGLGRSLFDKFKADVQNGKLPQVSWIVAPAGYTEHSD